MIFGIESLKSLKGQENLMLKNLQLRTRVENVQFFVMELIFCRQVRYSKHQRIALKTTVTSTLNFTRLLRVVNTPSVGTLRKDDDDGSENVGKKMNLRSFKLDRVNLDPLNMSIAGDFSWS